MAQKIVVELVDDVDGSTGEDIETIPFTWGGKPLEIDLKPDNAKSMREQLDFWASHARRAERTGRARPTRTAPSRQQSTDIREWARQHGHKVSERGRIPAAVTAEYEASH